MQKSRANRAKVLHETKTRCVLMIRTGAYDSYPDPVCGQRFRVEVLEHAELSVGKMIYR